MLEKQISGTVECRSYSFVLEAASLAQSRQFRHAISLLRAQQFEPTKEALMAILRRWLCRGDALHFLGVPKRNCGDTDAAMHSFDKQLR
jgi:hypothetical protein